MANDKQCRLFLDLPFALLAAESVASLGALVGFIRLIGTTLRNAVTMTAHWKQETTVEGRFWTLVAAIGRAVDRPAPSLMTVLATGLRLPPFAAIILGGLTSSAIVKLPMPPGLAPRFAPFDAGGRPA